RRGVVLAVQRVRRRCVLLGGQFVHVVGGRHGGGQRGGVQAIATQRRQRRGLAPACHGPAGDDQQQDAQAQPVPARAPTLARGRGLAQALLRGGQVAVFHR